MLDVNLGFPLSDRGRPEFVLVGARYQTRREATPTTGESDPAEGSFQRWHDETEYPHRANANFVYQRNIGRALGIAQRTALTEPVSLEFVHVAESPGDIVHWREESATAACLLALVARSGVAAGNPAVLISCDCLFGPGNLGVHRRLQWVRLLRGSPYADSRSSLIALRQKWQSAIAGSRVGVPVMALVLRREEAGLLASTVGRQPLPLIPTLFTHLRRRPAAWPALVAVTEKDTALLALALGIDASGFVERVELPLPKDFLYSVLFECGIDGSDSEGLFDACWAKMTDYIGSRLACTILPKLSPEHLGELDDLCASAATRPADWREFWRLAVPTIEDEIFACLHDLAENARRCFAP